MLYDKRRKGYSVISLTALVMAVSGLMLFSMLKSQSVFKLTQALDQQNQDFYLDESLRSITQEAFLSYSETSAYRVPGSFQGHLTELIEVANRNHSVNSCIATISVNQAPVFVPINEILPSGVREFSTNIPYPCGFRMGQLLESGPFSVIGKYQVIYDVYYKSANRAMRQVKIESTHFMMPITNVEAIEYVGLLSNSPSAYENPLIKVKMGQEAKILSMSNALKNEPSDVQKDQQLPFYYRNQVSACKNVFEAVWSTQHRNWLLHASYKEGYFSKESWAVHSFDGMEYTEETNTLLVDLNAWKGTFLGIVDKEGGLNVKIHGCSDGTQVINLGVYNYSKVPTQLELETPDQPIFGYFTNTLLSALPHYCGALFLGPKSQIKNQTLSVRGGFYFPSKTNALDLCRRVDVTSNKTLKAILSKQSPVMVFVESKIIF